MENVIDILVELAQSGTPVTLSSLANTFDKVNYLSCNYSGYYTFVNGVYGGQARVEYNEISYYIYFVPYYRNAKPDEDIKAKDDVKIVEIYNANKSRYLYFDKIYCDS